MFPHKWTINTLASRWQESPRIVKNLKNVEVQHTLQGKFTVISYSFFSIYWKKLITSKFIVI